MIDTEELEKLIHLPNILYDQIEHATVPQQDVAWIRLMSEGILRDLG